MASGQVTLITDSVDYPCCPYGRGTTRLTNVIGWSVNSTGDISFWLISSSDNAHGTWGICTSGSGYYIKLQPQVSYDGGSSWVTLDTKQHWVSEICGSGFTNTITMSTSLIGQLGTYHLTGNCQLRFLYYMTVAPDPSYEFPHAFPNESYSEVSQVPVVVEVDWVSTLKYNANGGTGAPANQTHMNASSVSSYAQTVSNTIPTRSGYQFQGWADSSSATTAQYHGGDTITIQKSSPTKTIYAVWKQEYNYSLAYNSDGGTPTPATQTYTGTETSHTFTVTSTVPTRVNYRFAGWKTGSTTYHAGDTISISSSTLSVTLTAVWEEFYRPGERRVSGTWSSHNRSGGACERKVSGTWTEMRTIDGGTGTGDEPTRKSSGTWYNQRKLGAE